MLYIYCLCLFEFYVRFFQYMIIKSRQNKRKLFMSQSAINTNQYKWICFSSSMKRSSLNFKLLVSRKYRRRSAVLFVNKYNFLPLQDRVQSYWISVCDYSTGNLINLSPNIVNSAEIMQWPFQITVCLCWKHVTEPYCGDLTRKLPIPETRWIGIDKTGHVLCNFFSDPGTEPKCVCIREK